MCECVCVWLREGEREFVKKSECESQLKRKLLKPFFLFAQSRKCVHKKADYPVLPDWAQFSNSIYTLDNSIFREHCTFSQYNSQSHKLSIVLWILLHNEIYFLLWAVQRINEICQICSGLTRLNIIQNLFQCDHQFMFISRSHVVQKLTHSHTGCNIVSSFAAQIRVLVDLFSSSFFTNGNI